MDQNLNEEEALDYIDVLANEDTKSIKSTKSDVSKMSSKLSIKSRLKENETKERVKMLIKRSEDTKSNGGISNRSKNSHKSNKSLLKRMKEKENSQDLNPLLECQEQKSQKALSKSRSDQSLVSNSGLGKYVRTLKNEVENQKNIKDKAISILRNLRNNKKTEDIDKFLRDFNN